MTRYRTIASALTVVIVGTAVAVILSPDASVAAAQRRAAYAVTGAGFCTTSESGDCALAAAATIDQVGNANGAFLLSIGLPRTHVIVSAKSGSVESGEVGLHATFDGPALVEDEATQALRQYPRAALRIDHGGAMTLTLEETMLTTQVTLGGVDIRQLPAAAQDSTHELGHYIGFPSSFDSGGPRFGIGFGFVTMSDGLEGLPDIAGLFRDTADGETGQVHGHLDFLKKVGDPATSSQPGFASRGSATCTFDSGAQVASAISLNVDLAAALLEFRAPRCGFRAQLPIRELPCAQPCRATTVIGLATGAPPAAEHAGRMLPAARVRVYSGPAGNASVNMKPPRRSSH